MIPKSSNNDNNYIYLYFICMCEEHPVLYQVFSLRNRFVLLDQSSLTSFGCMGVHNTAVPRFLVS